MSARLENTLSGDLFEPFHIGDLLLANRMVMAPMTRNRADENGVVSAAMVTYYRQRASAGLIIAESSPIAAEAVGYPNTPGIYTDAQVSGWLRLTNAVHSAGGRIFLQLLHAGRISHPSLLPGNAIPVAPSPVRPIGQAVTPAGMRDFVTPRPLGTAEIPDVVQRYAQAAEKARRAGFDGVEVHAGNGYLLDQFLRDGSNHRTDEYGGDALNRMRLLNEVLDAVFAFWPAERVGVRLTPENSFNSMSDSDPQAHFAYFVEQLGRRRVGYLHILEGDMLKQKADIGAGFARLGADGRDSTIKPAAGYPRRAGRSAGPAGVNYAALRSAFTGPYIANNGYDLVRAQAAVRTGAADLVAFGTPFLANPDLVRRYRENLPLNTADPSTYYVGGETGYTDYPFFQRAEALAA